MSWGTLSLSCTLFPALGVSRRPRSSRGPKGPQGTQDSQSLGSQEAPPPPLLPSLSAPCRDRPLSGVTPRLQAVVGWGSGAPQSPGRVHPVTPTPEQPQPPGRTPLLPAALGQWLEATSVFRFKPQKPARRAGGALRRPRGHRCVWLVSCITLCTDSCPRSPQNLSL